MITLPPIYMAHCSRPVKKQGSYYQPLLVVVLRHMNDQGPRNWWVTKCGFRSVDQALNTGAHLLNHPLESLGFLQYNFTCPLQLYSQTVDT